MNPIDATHAYAGACGRSRLQPLVADLPPHLRSALSSGPGAAARAAAEAAGPGGEILAIGVGTGLELPLLPGNVRVTGIDISAPMLRAARARVERKRLAQVKGSTSWTPPRSNFPPPRSTSRLPPM